MSYAQSRRIIDADSHLIELDDFVTNAATAAERPVIPRCPEEPSRFSGSDGPGP